MQAVISVLTDTHRNMERVLTLMRFQLDSLRQGNHASAYVLLSNAFGYMHRYPSLVHHPTEERICAKLVGYSPETQDLCLRIHDQHASFATTEGALLKELRTAQKDDGRGWRSIKEQGVAYCVEHANHIRREETELFPLALRWLKGADWDEIGDGHKAMVDPLFSDGELGHYDSLYDFLMLADRNYGSH
jgi:hemerythrin-like domain-containing protein